MVMPVTCIITVSLIGLMMVFYNNLQAQISQNSEELVQLYESREVTYIRTYDRLEHGFTQ